MRIAVVSFTKRGIALSETIAEKLGLKYEISLFTKHKTETNGEKTISETNYTEDTQTEAAAYIEGSLKMWTAENFAKGRALIFIGALGICVRTIAESLQDKMTDIPVLDLDEAGRFVIPVLSGHLGGANALAAELAEAIGAIPVVTTATDGAEAFAVDLFAKENGLGIVNRDGIVRASARSLEGKPVRIQLTDNEVADICLCTRKYGLGIGCRKGKSVEELKTFIYAELEKLGILPAEIGAIASIDLKKDEDGLIALAGQLKIPFITYTASMLEGAEGKFSDSDFVRETAGVGNVCERAAMLLSGNKGELVLPKTANNGMTIAVVKI